MKEVLKDSPIEFSTHRMPAGPEGSSVNLFREQFLADNFKFDQKYFANQLSWLNFAYVAALEKSEFIDHTEAAELRVGLNSLASKGFDGIKFKSQDEDLILHVEKALVAEVGDIAKKIHTGRSRNDMGHTLWRMVNREWNLMATQIVADITDTILNKAEEFKTDPLLAYTHGQPAQTISFGYYLVACATALVNDLTRLTNARAGINQSPMGAAALATSTWAIDRNEIAEALAFDQPVINAYYAVSANDHVIEFHQALRSVCKHISQIATDFHAWTDTDKHWIDVDPKFVQISSIMPHKRNPVVLEHIKSKLAALSTILDFGITQTLQTPFGDINNVEGDMKEFSEMALIPLFKYLNIFEQVLETVAINSERSTQACEEELCNMTELSDWLVREHNLTFRDAHTLTSSLVSNLLDANKKANQITGEDLSEVWKVEFQEDKEFTTEDVQNVINPAMIIEARDNLGGTSERQIDLQIHLLRTQLRDFKIKVHSDFSQIEDARRLCQQLPVVE